LPILLAFTLKTSFPNLNISNGGFSIAYLLIFEEERLLRDFFANCEKLFATIYIWVLLKELDYKNINTYLKL